MILNGLESLFFRLWLFFTLLPQETDRCFERAEMGSEDLKIFIVDNEIEICHLFKDFFDFMGYDSTYETNGKKFLEEIASKTYDVLFLDLRLDDISGIEILKESKRVHPSSEVIVVTGFGSDETVLSSLNYGAMSYIQKPISFSEIKVQTDLAYSKQNFNIMTNKIQNLIAGQDSSLVNHFQNIINLDMFSVFLNMSIDIDSLADLVLYGINGILSCQYCSFLFIDNINREIVISSDEPINRTVVSAIEKKLVETYETLANKKLEKTYVIRPSMSATFDENSSINKSL